MPDEEDGLTVYTVSAKDAIAFILESPTGHAEVSREGKIRWCNQSFADALNAHKEQILGTRLTDWAHPDDSELDKELADKISAGQLQQYRLVKRYRQLGHTEAMPRIVWGEKTVFGKFDSSGSFNGYRVTFVPYINSHDAVPTGRLEWKKWITVLVRFLVENWKTVLAVVIVLAGSTLRNLGELPAKLRAIREVSEELEGSSPDLRLPSPPASVGPSAPSIETKP